MKRSIAAVLLIVTSLAAFAQTPTNSAPSAGAPRQMLAPEERFKQLDTNGDGKVSFEEYKIGRTEELKNGPPPGVNLPQGRPVMSIEESFKSIDTNGDGVISKEEFLARFKNMRPGGAPPAADK